MKKIKDDIKNKTWEHYYLLWGSEGYLKNQYCSKLKEALLEDTDDMNLSIFTGPSVSEAEVVDIARTMPFFAERRVIILENSGFFSKAPEVFMSMMDNFPESTYFILLEDDIDKRSKFYKKISKIGYETCMNTPDEKMLVTWILGKVKDEGKVMRQDAAVYFVQKMGTDMNQLNAELEKLICYTMDQQEITRKDMDAICFVQIEDRIFEMLDAIGNKNRERALALYRDLVALREPAARILYMISRQYRILCFIKQMEKERKSKKEMAIKLGVRDFTVPRYLSQAAKYTEKDLMDKWEICQQTDEEIKKGILNDNVGLETIIYSITQ